MIFTICLLLSSLTKKYHSLKLHIFKLFDTYFEFSLLQRLFAISSIKLEVSCLFILFLFFKSISLINVNIIFALFAKNF